MERASLYDPIILDLGDIQVSHKLNLNIAARNGDWEAAKIIVYENPFILTQRIATNDQRAIHLAAGHGQGEFVEELVYLMSREDLEVQDADGFTALHMAALSGCMPAARVMVQKNPRLPHIVNHSGLIPFYYAILHRNKELVQYLCLVTTDEAPAQTFSGPLGAKLVVAATAAGYYDVVQYLVQLYPHLATAEDEERRSILSMMATMPINFFSGCRLGCWEKYIYQCVQWFHRDGQSFGALILKAILKVPGLYEVHEKQLQHVGASKLVQHVLRRVSESMSTQIQRDIVESAIKMAAAHGIVEILIESLQQFPHCIRNARESTQRNLVQLAILNRQERVFNFLLGNYAQNAFMAHGHVELEERTLYLAAKLPPASKFKSVSGSALQYQRELQWYKEVEKYVPPATRDLRNEDSETPWKVFRDEHAELAKKGKEWMKGTSRTCTIVATLIALSFFVAAYRIPGGNTDNDGISVFLKSKTFTVFATANALGLLLSLSSLVIFVSIVTSHFTEEDYLKLVPLPQRFFFGIALLSFAIYAMMIAYSAMQWTRFGSQLEWFSLPMILLFCLPGALIMLVQLCLLLEMFQWAYGSRISFGRSKSGFSTFFMAPSLLNVLDF